MKPIMLLLCMILSGTLGPAGDQGNKSLGQAQPVPSAFHTGSEKRVSALRVTVLSTMLADGRGIGEWGFAALVEADGHRLLFDTGHRPKTVLENARELGIDLTGVTEVVLSHNHSDHTGGLLTLRRELVKDNPEAIGRVHVGRGIFLSRPSASGQEGNAMIEVKAAFEATGGIFIEHNEPYQIFPGVWITGPVPRIHPERNWSGRGRIKTADGLVEDTIPEDQSLVIDTSEGLVIIAGCGHAGIVNTFAYARDQVRNTSIHAALGGFHLFQADDAHLEWTAGKMGDFGLEHLMGAHCTGINAVFTLRELAGLDRSTSVVGAVGAVFELGTGINPGFIAR